MIQIILYLSTRLNSSTQPNLKNNNLPYNYSTSPTQENKENINGGMRKPHNKPPIDAQQPHGRHTTKNMDKFNRDSLRNHGIPENRLKNMEHLNLNKETSPPKKDNLKNDIPLSNGNANNNTSCKRKFAKISNSPQETVSNPIKETSLEVGTVYDVSSMQLSSYNIILNTIFRLSLFT